MENLFDLGLQARRKAFIKLLDRAIEIGEELEQELAIMTSALEAKFPEKRSAA